MTPEGPAPQPSRLERLAQRAKLILAWERVWPGAVAVLMLVALFLVVSWLGLWLQLPRLGRIIGVAAFGLALIGVLVRALRIARPTRFDALARLDRDSGQKHQPASAFCDTLANAAGDATTKALWRLHQARLQNMADGLRLALPSPRMVDKDRYALRAGALVGVIAAAFVAGSERPLRLLAAFDWRSQGVLAAGFRLDAWVDPPAYTGRAPILLDARAGQGAADSARRIEAPVNSVVVVRGSAASGFKITTQGALAALAGPAQKDGAAVQTVTTKQDVNNGEQRFTLKGDAQLVLDQAGSRLAVFDLHAIADQPPVISLSSPPQANARGTLTLSYKISDDYGVVDAQATFTKPLLRGKPLEGRTLAEPPRVGLSLPNAQGGLGDGQTMADLSDHPWAGARVTMVLSARDEAGNVGSSAPQDVTLPSHPFTKPVARALAEQRRNLILAPDDHARVATALAAMMIAPDSFDTGAGVYLGLHVAARRLHMAREDADLVKVADLLWEMALRIEDGDLSQAERDLRAAQNKLREAMQRGAPDAEISKLMADVRAALDKFMRELADKQQREDGKNPRSAQNGRAAQTLTPQDLKAMMDRIEDMARSGNLAEAQKMLDQMQKMLENLQTAKRRQQDPAQREMNRTLDELDAMTREEQSLRDDTFRQQQKAQRQQRQQKSDGNGQKSPEDQQSQDQTDPNNGANDPSPTQSQKSLKDRQQALRQRLEALQERMKQQGQEGKDGLDEAQQAMKQAEDALGGAPSEDGKAVGAQGKALDGLRKGAQKLAEAMQKQGAGQDPGQADGQGQDNPGQGQQQGQGRGRGDPLGREQNANGQQNQGDGQVALSAAQRAQRVLQELRKRLGDTFRSRQETDYLERLLKRY